MTAPRATYRLQLHAGFGFNDAAEIAPYLAQLGVSHVYLSPIFKARPGSVHGYDVTDHNQLNPELGTENDFSSMIDAFRDQGLGRILDIVPNHVGVWGADNPLWLDVLEWGPYSQYAGWFDIDWSAQDGKLLAPVLGAQYGEELRSGKLKLHFEEDGGFAVWAYDAHKLPIHPLTFSLILGRQHPALDRMADLFLDLPQWRPQVAERARALKSELVVLANKDEGVRAAIEARVDEFNSDWRELDRLIREQFWRVAFHRVAEDEINYRRFFNINDLAGLRIEAGPVFDHVHARIFRMLESGEIDGLRIDHIDGLFDPKAYLDALRAGAKAPFYLVVEKILAPHESLRADWPVEGTTGYDYTNLALGVLVDPGSEQAFTRAYYDLAGEDQDFAAVARDGKLRIMENEMASELNALGRRAAQLAGESPMTADLTRALLQRAIRQVVANFPVYRTYLDFAGMPADADRRDIAWAMTRARRSDPDVHPSAFDFLQNMLMAETEQPPTQELSHTAALRFAMKVQQFSGPVMAKGVEDTAFYRYNRFVALNEVGGAPERFGLAPALFHKANAARAQNWPHAMLATATHDTKRGEDNRARLAVLSEMPEEWRRQVETWTRILRARRGDVERRSSLRTATTNTCSTRCSWAPGPSTCLTLPAPRSWRLTAPAFTPHWRNHCARRSAARVGRRPTSTTSRRRRRSRRRRCGLIRSDPISSRSCGVWRALESRTVSLRRWANSPRRASPIFTRAASCGTSTLSIPTIGVPSISVSGTRPSRMSPPISQFRKSGRRCSRSSWASGRTAG